MVGRWEVGWLEVGWLEVDDKWSEKLSRVTEMCYILVRYWLHDEVDTVVLCLAALSKADMPIP